MKITLKQSYLAAFQVLDEIFNDTRNRELGNFLSGMNPYLFSDLMPADPAMWYEWASCVEKMNKCGLYESNDVLAALNMLLQVNQQYYNYEVNKLIQSITEKIQIGRWKMIFEMAYTIA